MLTSLPLTNKHWTELAKNMTFVQTRKNLNTLARHSVLSNDKIVSMLADRLADPEQVHRSKTFPYELLAAYLNITSDVPQKLSVALQQAVEHSLVNIPEIDGKIYVLVDVSGSMQDPVTGNRGSATTKIRNIDVASLMASSLMRRNKDVEVIPFDTSVHQSNLNPLDSVMTNATKLAKFGGGGTDCACAVQHLNNKNAKGDMLIMVSDNMSWVSNYSPNYYNPRGTNMANEWATFKNRNPKAKLVLLDISPNTTTQVNSQKDVLNLGGFSDHCFDLIANFVEFGNDQDLWVKTVESVEI